VARVSVLDPAIVDHRFFSRASGTIINPQNQRIATFAGGTNSAFGGEDGKRLLVLGGTTMLVIQMNLPGLPF